MSQFDFTNPPIPTGELGVFDSQTQQPRPLTKEEAQIIQPQLEAVEPIETPVADDEILPEFKPTGLQGNPKTVDISELSESKQQEIFESLEKAQKVFHPPASEEAEKPVEEEKKTPEEVMDEIDKDPFPDIEINDHMKELYLRACMAGSPYSREFSNQKGNIKLRFRTLSISEWDAVREALEILAKKKMFVSIAQVQIMNYRLAVAASIERLYIDNTEFGGTVNDYFFTSPLEEYPEEHYTGEHVDTVEPINMTSGHRILQANQDRFNKVNAVLYNLMLNLYKRFDAEVAKLNRELENELNFSNATLG